MEQKRVLWIVAAVGLFLLVVIGTALWISSPINKTQPSLSPVEIAGSSWSRSNAQAQATNTGLSGMNSSSSTDSITSIDFTGDGTIQSQAPVNLNKLDSSAADSSAPAQTTQNEPTSGDTHTSSAGLAQTAVTLNVNITPSNVNSSEYNATTQQTEQAPKQQTPTTSAAAENASNSNNASTSSPATVAPKTTVTVASNTASTSATTTSATKPATTTTSSSAKVTVSNSTASSSSGIKTVPTNQPDQFWVQVASFTGKKNAEDARTALSEQKITGEVFTYQDAQGTIYYRLRVGPYKTKSEAEYWHKIIKEIEQFNGTDSYVVNSTVN